MQDTENTFDLDKARELVSNRLLWPRVRDFLWDFAPQVHPSWLEGLGSLDDLEQRSNLVLLESPRVKSYILNSLGVEPCFHPFLKDDGSRLLLLDGKTLVEITKWLGALACAEKMRMVTDGATVRALKAALPGVYPEVFGYTAYFRGNDFKCIGTETQGVQRPEDVVSAGLEMLFSATAGLPESLVSRLKFKLPKVLHASAFRREIKYTVILKLLKLKFPEAYSLCCC